MAAAKRTTQMSRRIMTATPLIRKLEAPSGTDHDTETHCSQLRRWKQIPSLSLSLSLVLRFLVEAILIYYGARGSAGRTTACSRWAETGNRQGERKGSLSLPAGKGLVGLSGRQQAGKRNVLERT
ncbi:hypothetical protein MPTK1_2g08340 [Marchantia polymorpha subsp. ruderalis]|uniref:Uncharacterized protein n=1 Tax=Marchantia polymorpha TaxID=3197 RepID=A0A2R6XGV5_MARPO|nr:hypothetical protein MARPO_0015s0119 [Marchantia polymorpha]BBN01555.1 hypothetical protein Mp_2g08340 [Marchantia polymorpha subsp. ruderalis]|eukprot:PTQ45321.1 hypothetical protein MARPO_0015s0119 [Marchantia polymorpha]